MWQSSADNLAVHVGQGKQRLLNGKVVGATWLCAEVTPLPQLVWREDDDVLVKDITTAGGAEGPMPWLASQWAHTEKGSKVKMDQPKKKDAADKDERKTNAQHEVPNNKLRLSNFRCHGPWKRMKDPNLQAIKTHNYAF